MADRLTLLQVNDVHGYLELHPELFWTGEQARYRMAGGMPGLPLSSEMPAMSGRVGFLRLTAATPSTGPTRPSNRRVRRSSRSSTPSGLAL